MKRYEILALVQACQELVDWAWDGDGWRGTRNMKNAPFHYHKIKLALEPLKSLFQEELSQD